MTIRVGHSPDADDAFMFWALANGQVESPFQFEHILKDIQTLNDWAREGRLETTAVSVHAYAHVADKYAVLRHGGSFGDGYGPMLVSREPLDKEAIADLEIAVPGPLTSAYLALQLYMPSPKAKFLPFDQIVPAVQRGDIPVGLIIHESQLTHQQEGLHLIEDLGAWWQRETNGLPLPLGVNVVRKDLGDEAMREIARCMRETIRLGLERRTEALAYAMQFGRGLDVETADQFVGMYVNELTQDMGERGLQAIRLFLQMGAERGLVPPVALRLV